MGDRNEKGFLTMSLIVKEPKLSLSPTGEEFNWTRDEIIKWVREVAKLLPKCIAPPGEPGPPEGIITQMVRIAGFIEDLSLPNGLLLFGQNKANDSPPHHFARERDTNNTKPKLEDKRFITLDQIFFGNKVWNHYDALGYFLMGVGEVPKMATKATFYMPLTAMYGKWCMQLGGHADDDKSYKKSNLRVGTWPSVFQCTWLDSKASVKNGFPFRFSLGASFAGCDFSKTIPGIQNDDWRYRLLQKRVERLQKYDSFPNEKKWPDEATTGSSWGNCAEVYPFCMMFKLAEEPDNIHGLALNKPCLERTKDLNKGYEEEKLMKSRCVWSPCKNCQWVFSYRWGTRERDEKDLPTADRGVYNKYSYNWMPEEGMARALKSVAN